MRRKSNRCVAFVICAIVATNVLFVMVNKKNSDSYIEAKATVVDASDVRVSDNRRSIQGNTVTRMHQDITYEYEFNGDVYTVDFEDTPIMSGAYEKGSEFTVYLDNSGNVVEYKMNTNTYIAFCLIQAVFVFVMLGIVRDIRMVRDYDL